MHGNSLHVHSYSSAFDVLKKSTDLVLQSKNQPSASVKSLDNSHCGIKMHQNKLGCFLFTLCTSYGVLYNSVHV